MKSSLTWHVIVRKFVIRREVQPKKEGAKPYTKVRGLIGIMITVVLILIYRHQRSSVS